MGLNAMKSWGAAVGAAALVVALSLPSLLGDIRPPAVPADAALPGESSAPDDVGEGSGTTKLVALTFDDGPRRSSTTRLLDGLAERGVKATFFLVGKNVEVNRDLVLRMEEEGHQVGVHTYDHESRLTGLNHADFSAQVDRTRDLLTEILGHNGFLLRPPYGMTDAGVKKWAGAPIIIWSVDPEDWKDQNADRVTAFLTETVKDGDVILMHDIFDASVDAALRAVDALHAKGYLFVTVDELFSQRGVPLEAGQSYWNAYP